MSPLHLRHGRYQFMVATLLTHLLPSGETSVGATISTSDNMKVPGVIWAPHAFFQQHGEASALPAAPDICVEVLSPVNRALEIEQKR